MQQPELYYLFWALWGVGLAGAGHWYKNLMWTTCGVVVFVINILQFLYWIHALHTG